jgi:uncharacterized coiled-coil protein SlyX
MDRNFKYQPLSHRLQFGRTLLTLCILALALFSASSRAQETHAPDAASRLDQRMDQLMKTLTETQQTLLQSQQELQRLREEIRGLRANAAAKPGFTTPPEAVAAGITDPEPATVSSSNPTDLQHLHEEQEALQAEIKQHEQTKIETASKYGLEVRGLVLFQAFSNAGVVDNLDLPTVAFPRTPGISHGSLGATMRQTTLGLHAHGPKLLGASSSADVSIDFFGDIAYSLYSSPGSSVRLKRAQMELEWDKTTLQAGIDSPLISPLSPTSYATVAQPALSWAGNLWTWAPQLRLEQRLPLGTRQSIHLEAGLWDPQSVGSTSDRIGRPISPGELSRRPGYEGRVSYYAGPEERAMQFGLGIYSSRQVYGSSPFIHSWAATADWKVPLSHWLELSGEAYRGRSIGSLGGGAYKDVLTGVSRITGRSQTNGVDAVGGWAQLKVRPTGWIETNLMWGLDDALASNFRRLILTSSSDPLQFYTRNSMGAANLILRPKTYLIFSPEYRRIASWQTTGRPGTANIFTLSAGYQF